MSKILVAGIGNIFFGDDAFGVEVVRVLASRRVPDDVSVVDFGIRGIDLTYALLEPWDAAILVDAVRRGGTPGSLYVLAPEAEASGEVPEAHDLAPAKVLATVREMGGSLDRVFLVGCEPEAVEEMSMEMSATVRGAIERAADLVMELVETIHA